MLRRPQDSHDLWWKGLSSLGFDATVYRFKRKEYREEGREEVGGEEGYKETPSISFLCL